MIQYPVGQSSPDAPRSVRPLPPPKRRWGTGSAGKWQPWWPFIKDSEVPLVAGLKGFPRTAEERFLEASWEETCEWLAQIAPQEVTQQMAATMRKVAAVDPSDEELQRISDKWRN